MTFNIIYEKKKKQNSYTMIAYIKKLSVFVCQERDISLVGKYLHENDDKDCEILI
jgi:hypothetical protein